MIKVVVSRTILIIVKQFGTAIVTEASFFSEDLMLMSLEDMPSHGFMRHDSVNTTSE